MNSNHDTSFILDTLKENKPFASSISSHPLKSRYPDVESLYKTQINDIRSIISIKEKIDSGLMVSVYGEAGSGKTHLICRLFDEKDDVKEQMLYAYIKPITNPDEGFAYLLHEIIVYLMKERSSRNSMKQLDHIACKLISSMLINLDSEKGKNSRLKGFADKCRNDYRCIYQKEYTKKENKQKLYKYCYRKITNDYPELYEDFIKVFLNFCLYPDKRHIAVNWMKGGVLDEKDLVSINISRNRVNDGSRRMEVESKKILESFDILLNHYYGRPLVVFFDQLENYSKADSIRNLEEILMFLSDHSNMMIPVVFIREQIWDTKIVSHFQKPAIERMESNRFFLNGCSQKEAYDLIRSRLKYVLKDIPAPNDLYPFYPDYKKQLDMIVRFQENHPRYIIKECNRLLQAIINADIEPMPESVTMASHYKTKHLEILSEWEIYEPDKGRLLLALELYLENRPKNSAYNVSDLKHNPTGENKYIHMTGSVHSNGKVYKSFFMADVSLHHASVAATLKRGIAHLSEKAGHKAVYIRDKRSLFKSRPNWKATNDLKDEFHRKGGDFIILNREDAAWWYALAKLKFDVTAGDVLIDNDRTATMEDLKNFISNDMNGAAYPAFKALDDSFTKDKAVKSMKPNKTPKKEESVKIIDEARNKLKSGPAGMMKADTLSSALSKSMSHNITTDSLITILSQEKSVFGFISASDGMLIQYKGIS